MEYTVHLAKLQVIYKKDSTEVSTVKVIQFNSEALFENDSVALAITKAQELADSTGNQYVVFQPRHKFYRGYGF